MLLLSPPLLIKPPKKMERRLSYTSHKDWGVFQTHELAKAYASSDGFRRPQDSFGVGSNRVTLELEGEAVFRSPSPPPGWGRRRRWRTWQASRASRSSQKYKPTTSQWSFLHVLKTTALGNDSIKGANTTSPQTGIFHPGLTPGSERRLLGTRHSLLPAGNGR